MRVYHLIIICLLLLVPAAYLDTRFVGATGFNNYLLVCFVEMVCFVMGILIGYVYAIERAER